MDERRAERVRGAIAPHTTPTIPQREAPEIAPCPLGVSADIDSLPPALLSTEALDHLLECVPRPKLAASLLEALSRRYESGPVAVSSHAVVDARALRIPGFRWPNRCRKLVERQRDPATDSARRIP